MWGQPPFGKFRAGSRLSAERSDAEAPTKPAFAFFPQAPDIPTVLPAAALAALVPRLHGGALPRSIRNLLLLQFFQQRVPKRSRKESLIYMSSTKQKLRLAGAFAALATLALAVSCKGFFQNPTVTSITIDPPSPTVSVGLTDQLTAAGTDSNGNPLNLTGGTSCTGTTVCWSSATPSVATVSTGGLLTGVSAGTSSITAASGTASATTTATVTLGNVTTIVLGPSGLTSFSMPESSTAPLADCLTATATAGGQQVDVTTSVTWVTPNTSLIQLQNLIEPMCVTSFAMTGTTTVYATYLSGDTTITSNSVSVTVTGP
jgi:hypothetical protein